MLSLVGVDRTERPLTYLTVRELEVAAVDHSARIRDARLHSRRDPEQRPAHSERNENAPTPAEASKSMHRFSFRPPG